MTYSKFTSRLNSLKTNRPKVKWAIVGVLMLLSVVALNLPNTNAATDFCRDCQNACYEEIYNWQTGSFARCINGGGGSSACSKQAKDDWNNCALVCNFAGCRVPYYDQ